MWVMRRDWEAEILEEVSAAEKCVPFGYCMLGLVLMTYLLQT